MLNCFLFLNLLPNSAQQKKTIVFILMGHALKTVIFLTLENLFCVSDAADSLAGSDLIISMVINDS